MLLFAGAFKPWHIFVLIVVLVLLFGASKLPEIAKNVGKSAKVLKKEMKELTEDDMKVESVPAPKPAVEPTSEEN
ncbi:twin arginine-targeting protein translocase, TatA/E family [Gleimia coleocanis DSM 15436]|uniref:Sec-independent protein translocase protein TatA n=1 Tax=Gleimia coleocanis DSM 15436 TaxID=525245 RepID=C0W1J6_9ACTO|nr:twin-arginine translocase TatA/TatE family subunit [Gleimia coleocanis]EEH63362.1 twin arginine-targeting protein translocase, TatA/E family [Gleimia coleocanis DSM 15436]